MMIVDMSAHKTTYETVSMISSRFKMTCVQCIWTMLNCYPRIKNLESMTGIRYTDFEQQEFIAKYLKQLGRIYHLDIYLPKSIHPQASSYFANGLFGPQKHCQKVHLRIRRSFHQLLPLNQALMA